MESTGVYWIPFFQILEARGFKVFLVNAHHVKNVPGGKSDVSDCQWLQDLHAVALLRGSFRPEQAVVHGAIDPASPRQPGADGIESRATHAKGSRSDEPATPPRDQRYHRRDRGSDRGGQPGGRAQPAYAGRTPRPADES